MKKKVTLTLDKDIWLVFRLSCIGRGLSGSDVIDRLMAEQLKRWQDTPRKEDDTCEGV